MRHVLALSLIALTFPPRPRLVIVDRYHEMLYNKCYFSTYPNWIFPPWRYRDVSSACEYLGWAERHPK